MKISQWKLESPHTKNKLWKKKASNEWTWNRVSMNIYKQKWDCILHICIFVISTFASSDTLSKLFWINWKKNVYAFPSLKGTQKVEYCLHLTNLFIPTELEMNGSDPLYKNVKVWKFLYLPKHRNIKKIFSENKNSCPFYTNLK